MTTSTKTRIIHSAVRLFARTGYDGMSMRDLAKESGVGLSSIYHFFSDKDDMLTSVFSVINRQIQQDLQVLPQRKDARSMLVDRIQFHFDHIDSMIFILKYYLHFRPYVMQLENESEASNSFSHMHDVIQMGCKTGEFICKDAAEDAKMITHLVNGFMLEYYPQNPLGDDRKKLVKHLSDFIVRALEPQKSNHANVTANGS